MNNANRSITMGELEVVENAAREMRTIGAFLSGLELTLIEGEGRRGIWNFGEKLYEQGKRTQEVIKGVYARARTEKETPTDSPSKSQ